MIVLIFLFGILGGAFGGILLKMGSSQIGRIEIHSVGQLIDFMFKLFTNVRSLSGIALYFLSAVAWAYLLTKLELSFVQPILALTYVVTPILAIFLLDENVTSMRWLGILIIIGGVFVVARTAS